MGRSLLPEAIEHYVSSVITHESTLEQRLRTETWQLPQRGMLSGPDSGALLALLARSIGTRRALEIGTFTGYTALKVASVLPAAGRLICCDTSVEWTDIARRYWAEAGLADRIELRLGHAAATLAGLLEDNGAGAYDFAFIDADKSSYDGYYEACLQLLRPGGLIVLDNMLWGGTVADANVHDPDTDALRALNLKVSRDDRVDSALLTVGDGLMLARKR
jgi:O-methyltransferase